LPEGLDFAQGRAAARAALGEPTRSGGPVRSVTGPAVFFWDRWERPTYIIHLQYPEDCQAIEMITLSRPSG
jgi:hypothetical protein